MENPKSELEKIMVEIKDGSWIVQFDSISRLRSIVEFNKELLVDDSLSCILNELLQCLSTLRSGVAKLALMCLNEIILKLQKKLGHFS